jgi:methanogenic corrinoid protein MtbC1
VIVLGLALHRRGWRIVYLGADAPAEAFDSVALALAPARVVVATEAFDPLDLAAEL